MTLRVPLVAFVAGFALCIGIVPSRSASLDPQEAARFVQKAGTDAISSLSAGNLSADQRNARVRQIILTNFDAPGIGRFVLGRRWDGAPESQKSRFLDAFRNALVDLYSAKFLEYSDESLKVVDASADQDSVLVHSTVTSLDGADTYQIDWRVIQVDGTFKLLDVVIDGVSMTLTQKQDYDAVLRTAGGDLDILIAKLHGKSP